MTAILVTGSTGTLGRALVPRLAAAGHRVRSLSRRPPPPSAAPGAWATGDLRRNTGLDEAVAGMDVIIHCATALIGDQAAAQNLVGAARRAGTPPGHAFAGLRRGGHLAPDQATGTVTFHEFLAARFTSRRPR